MKIPQLLIITAVIGVATPCIGSLLGARTTSPARAREADMQDCPFVEPYFYASTAEKAAASGMWMSG